MVTFEPCMLRTQAPSRCLPTGGAAAPVDDLGLVDLVPRVVGRGQARRGTDGAVDVDHAAAGATDQMVVVVADPILVARRRPGGLDAPEQTHVGQHADGVVHRAARDGADVGPDDLDHVVGGEVGPARHRPQHGQALRGDLETLLPKERQPGLPSYLQPLQTCTRL